MANARSLCTPRSAMTVYIYFEVDKKTEKEIVNLVEKVIEGKKKGIDTRELEGEIDRLVYWLYGLSEEEVGIIEGKD